MFETEHHPRSSIGRRLEIASPMTESRRSERMIGHSRINDLVFENTGRLVRAAERNMINGVLPDSVGSRRLLAPFIAVSK